MTGALRLTEDIPAIVILKVPLQGMTDSHARVLRLDQKVALITGASNGLGRAIALAYASNGTKFIACADLKADPAQDAHDRGITTHDEICQKYGDGKASYVQCDVTKTRDMEKAVAFAVAEGGRLDMYVKG